MCQVVGSSQVATGEPGIAIDNMLQHDVALSCDQLNANVQFGRPIHGSDGPSSLATRLAEASGVIPPSGSMSRRSQVSQCDHSVTNSGQ
jgi:hypothetical protein